MALIVVLESHPPTPVVTEVTLIATGLAVALAELYSEVIGEWTKSRQMVQRHHVRHIAKDVAAVFFGIVFPGFYFIIASFGWIETTTAFTLTKWTGLALIAGYGFAAGRLSGASVKISLLHALAVGLVGIALMVVVLVLVARATRETTTAPAVPSEPELADAVA
jgi:VIT1/CCC1 family predicted Fe2+/Mn2+ transporter